MNLRTLASILAAASLVACSNKYDSAALGVTWTPPNGVQLEKEQAGPPGVAEFTSDIEIRSVQGKLELPEDADLGQVLARASLEAQLQDLLPKDAPGLAVVSQVRGTLQTGPVARYELKNADMRTLLYVVPGPGRYLVLRARASEARFPKLQTSFERSLASLRFRAAH